MRDYRDWRTNGNAYIDVRGGVYARTSSSTFGASRTVSLIAETEKKYDVKNYYRRTENNKRNRCFT